MSNCCGFQTCSGKGGGFLVISLAVAAVLAVGLWAYVGRKSPDPATAEVPAERTGTPGPAQAGEAVAPAEAKGTEKAAADEPARHDVVLLNSQTFDQGVAKGVTLVDFYADWCGPCRTMAPILKEVAHDLGAAAKVAKVNVDEDRELAQRFRVRGIPLLVVLKDGKEVQRMVGLQQKGNVLRIVKSHVN